MPTTTRNSSATWATYKAIQDQTIDLFAIQYNNTSGANNFQFTTLGGRWLGSHDSWLWEAEGGVQFGDNTDGSDHQAGFATGGLGYKWADACWTAHALGLLRLGHWRRRLGAGQGFNHLFPLAHKYLGFMDLFGRSNIQSPNVQLTMQPTPKLKLLAWYYYLMLDTCADTPYTVIMTPLTPGNRPVSRDLGHELDLTATYQSTPAWTCSSAIRTSSSGDYYDADLPALPFRGNADFFYVQYQWNF